MKTIMKLPSTIAFLLAISGVFAASYNGNLVPMAFGQVPDNPSTPNTNETDCCFGQLVPSNCPGGTAQCQVICNGNLYPAYGVDAGVVCSTALKYTP